ncbi:hypothetical protein H9Q16_19885 [Sulfitobacter sp. TSTF-M16]|uniref:Uncharacterized protein n=1 Tax=Sulfitobacter aestuariivivens TaxID=2766981 RepID=A0A927D865_9RHOB|nr:hypothetical protein [Sulfitobacter aestuariivivens]MBD3666201.1 hypothetical protein [Sulfitobacter aestuariivivens]
MARGTRYRAPYSKIAWLLAILAAYILTRPYVGLYHDAVLYTAQALQQSGAADLSEDLFFRFGNQGNLVLFPYVQGWLTAQIGLGPALKLLTALQAFLWLFALAMLARTIYPERRNWLIAMAITVLMGAGYGIGVLSYAEGFVTPRPFAEAFGMMALAFALRDETRRALLALIVCTVCHPLVGLSVSGIWLTLAFVASIRLVTLVLLGLALIVAAAQAGVAPLSWLLETHDPVWGELLNKYRSLGFLSDWGWFPVLVHALNVVVLLIATRSRDHLIATVATATLQMGVLFIAINLVGADLLENRLISALQPWRVLAWVALFGNLLVLHLLVSKSARSAAFIILFMALAVNVVEHLTGVSHVFSTAMAPLVLLAYWTDRPGAFWRWFNALLAVLATVVVVALGGYVYVEFGDLLTDAIAQIVTALLIAATFLVKGRENTILLAGAAFIAAVIQFDRQSDRARFMESDTPMPQEVIETLQGDGIYWEDGAGLMWTKVRKPLFYSCKQRSGTLFYREQAIEHERRGQLLAPLNTFDFTQIPPGRCPAPADPDATGPADANAVKEVCKAVPELDHIVLHNPVEGLEMDRWDLPIGPEGQTVYHAACDPLRVEPPRALEDYDWYPGASRGR